MSDLYKEGAGAQYNPGSRLRHPHVAPSHSHRGQSAFKWQGLDRDRGELGTGRLSRYGTWS